MRKAFIAQGMSGRASRPGAFPTALTGTSVLAYRYNAATWFRRTAAAVPVLHHREGLAVLATIEVVPNDARRLRSLYDWLSGDPRIASDVGIRLRAAEGEPGTQGGLFDAVNILFNDAVALASASISFATWRRSRHEDRGAVVIERDGVKVTLPADGEWTEPMIRAAFGLAAVAPEGEDPRAGQGECDE